MTTLAIDGDTPVRNSPFPRRILIGESEIEALHQLLEKERTTGGGFDRYGGEHVDAYEREFAAFHGMRYATATSSGTAAVHAALGALRMDIAGEVISSPITDPGGVAPILWCNNVPLFGDADPETMNVRADSIAERISDVTRAIIVTHLAGQPADMDPIMAVANAHGIPVIEDCSQAHGATYKGRLVGTMGAMGVFSLMGGKHHTAGGQGGMVITDDETLYWNAKRFADRGKPFNSDGKKNLFLGLNYRMTELEAVIGRTQLGKLPEVVRRRQELARALGERIAHLKTIRIGTVIPGAESSYWLLMLRFDAEAAAVTKAQFARAVAAEGIPVDPHYDWIVYETPWFRDQANYGASGCPWTCPYYGREVTYEGSCPDARRAVDRHMVLHWHEGYTLNEVNDIAAALEKVDRAYRK